MDHPHPRSSFAVESLIVGRPKSTQKGELITSFVKDVFDKTYDPKKTSNEAEGSIEVADFAEDNDGIHTNTIAHRRNKELRRNILRAKVCAFCNDSDPTVAGGFIGPYPFVGSFSSRNDIETKRIFWAHDHCAR